MQTLTDGISVGKPMVPLGVNIYSLFVGKIPRQFLSSTKGVSVGISNGFFPSVLCYFLVMWILGVFWTISGLCWVFVSTMISRLFSP